MNLLKTLKKKGKAISSNELIEQNQRYRLPKYNQVIVLFIDYCVNWKYL